MLANAVFITQLRGSPFFGASSPATPTYLWAFLAAGLAGLYATARRGSSWGTLVAQFAATVGP